MKKAYKVLSVLMVVLMIAITCTNVFAANVLDYMNGQADGVETEKIGTIGNKLLTIIVNVGMVLAVVVVAVLGIKYMMGSTEEKAEYKKTMMPYLVGAILVFGASAIGRAVVGIGISLTETTIS